MRRVVPEHLAGGVDAQPDRRRRFRRRRRGIGPLRQVHGDRVRSDRGGDHEDDEEHQEHVNQGVTLMSDIDSLPEFALKAICVASGQLRSLMATKPTFRIPCCWAVCTTSRTMRYLVVLSPRTLICGCGGFCASTESRLSSSSVVIGSSFQKRAPEGSIAMVMGGTCGVSWSRLLTWASGR